MSKVTHFQRYSQKENVVTNNTLLLFSRIHEYSSRKFERLLFELLSLEFDIGPNFVQQVGSGTSTPDGIISQSSFKVLIETKVDAWVNTDQLYRHLMSFGAEEKRVLLLLSKQKLGTIESGKIRKEIQEKAKDKVGFVSTTFEEVVLKTKSLFDQNIDAEFWPILMDYEEFCRDTGLYDASAYLMRAVPCGDSLADNLKFGIYYMPKDRGFSDHSYIGLYNRKAIRAVGEIQAIALVSLDSSEKILVEKGEIGESEKNRILGIVASSITNLGWDVSEGHRFFVVKEFHPTEFKKESVGGLFGVKYFNLKEEIKDIEKKSLKAVADELSLKIWK